MITRKTFIIFLIWLFVGVIVFLLNSTKISSSSRYKLAEGIISNVKCVHPTKDYYLGDVKLFYNNNKKFIKFKSSILGWDNFDKKCKNLKDSIKIGQHLKAKIYDNVVGDVLIDNIKIHNGKKTITSYNNYINNSIYIIVFVALYITLMRIKNIRIRKTKYYKYILYIMIILAIVRFFN